MVAVLVALMMAIVGYIFGRAKTFLEGKQRVYEEILPILLRAAYDPVNQDEEGLNKALSKLWLYGNKNVAKKMDEAVSIMVQPIRGDITKALQEAIAEMRKDIQTFFYWERIKPEEIKHLYARITSFGRIDKIAETGQKKGDNLHGNRS